MDFLASSGALSRPSRHGFAGSYGVIQGTIETDQMDLSRHTPMICRAVACHPGVSHKTFTSTTKGRLIAIQIQ